MDQLELAAQEDSQVCLDRLDLLEVLARLDHLALVEAEVNVGQPVPLDLLDQLDLGQNAEKLDLLDPLDPLDPWDLLDPLDLLEKEDNVVRLDHKDHQVCSFSKPFFK